MKESRSLDPRVTSGQSTFGGATLIQTVETVDGRAFEFALRTHTHKWRAYLPSERLFLLSRCPAYLVYAGQLQRSTVNQRRVRFQLSGGLCEHTQYILVHVSASGRP